MLIPLIYKSKDECKQNCLILIFSLFEKKKLVKNDIIYLSLNMLLDKFLKDMLADKKIIDQKLKYAITNVIIEYSQDINETLETYMRYSWDIQLKYIARTANA